MLIFAVGVPLAYQGPSVEAVDPNIKVGSKLVISSITGVAIIRNNNTRAPDLKPASIDFSIEVTKVNNTGYQFKVTSGKITVDGVTFTVLRGGGRVVEDEAKQITFMHGHVRGTGPTGNFTYGCSGPLAKVDGKTIGGMDGIFKSGDRKFKIDWLAQARPGN